jgi:hypothetical protein
MFGLRTAFGRWLGERVQSNADFLKTLRAARQLASNEGDKTHVAWLDSDIERVARDERMERARAATRPYPDTVWER